MKCKLCDYDDGVEWDYRRRYCDKCKLIRNRRHHVKRLANWTLIYTNKGIELRNG